MDQIESIIASYNKIIDELYNIEKQIQNSCFASNSDLKPAAHNFYTNMGILVVQAQAVLARCESDIIEGEYIIDPDFQGVDTNVTKIIRKQW